MITLAENVVAEVLTGQAADRVDTSAGEVCLAVRRN